MELGPGAGFILTLIELKTGPTPLQRERQEHRDVIQCLDILVRLVPGSDVKMAIRCCHCMTVNKCENPLTQSVLIRTVFNLCENTQNSHNFCSISVLFFFSLKDNIRGHLPMKIILAVYVPYSITADAILTIPVYT
jgi:hypothetical protein